MITAVRVLGKNRPPGSLPHGYWRRRRLSLASAGLTGVAGARARVRAGRGRHPAGRDLLPYPVPPAVAVGGHLGYVRADGHGRVATRDTAAGVAGECDAAADGRTT
jgi:hypothetical protein